MQPIRNFLVKLAAADPKWQDEALKMVNLIDLYWSDDHPPIPTGTMEFVRLLERGEIYLDKDLKPQWSETKCVNAHDRCYGGAGGPCPYCELR